MRIGILLLSLNDKYLDHTGSIPTRPNFDKKFLLDLVEGEDITCSEHTLQKLPASILEKVNSINKIGTIDLGIRTMYENPPDLLFIVRSREWITAGKKFELKQWKPILQLKEFEIWKVRK